jgi:hypothetical protein
LEELEQRTHLAASQLSDFMPLTLGSQWVYNEVEDGVRSTSTETIAASTVRIHGQRTFQSIEEDSDGRSISLYSISSSGAVQLHRIRDEDSTITFNSPVTFPKYFRLGQRAIVEGEMEIVMYSGQIRMKGEYHVEILSARREQVRVPAGTFSTLKVEMKLEMSAEYHKGGVNIEVSSTGVLTDWSAKGVGSVKSSDKSHTELAVNGRHKVDDSTSRSSLRSYTITPG